MFILLLALMAQEMPLQQSDVPELVTRASIYPDETVLELADRDTYLMGPGDMVTVVIAGGTSQYMMGAGFSPWAEYTVGGDGCLSVAGIGSIPVSGLTIEEAQKELQAMAARYYPSVSVTLSLEKPRFLKVNVGGMVSQPGTYVLSALDRVSDALLLAGGISSFGSRHGVMYTADGDSIPVNLEMIPGTATHVSDPFLLNNADIIMEVCRNPVFILSSASGMESMEPKSGEDLRSLLSRMGGVGGDVDLSRSMILRDGERFGAWSDSLGFNTMSLRPGDTLLFVSLRDSVTVGGAVKHPGLVPYDPGSTVEDYVVYAGGRLHTSGSGISVRRNGRDVDFEGDPRTARLMPGDVVEVGYDWFARNGTMVKVLVSVVSLGITIYNVATR